MYSDVYRCWGKYGYLDAWQQFCQYLDFYYVIFDGNLLDSYEEYNNIYNEAPAGMETDDEAEYYVEEVFTLAEKNGADMIFN